MAKADAAAGRGALRGRRDNVRGHAVFARWTPGPPPDTPPIVLVHGLVVSSVFLREPLARLGPRHRAFAPDLPGYGRSSKRRRTLSIEEQGTLLGAWMDELGLRRAIVAGTSMGTQYASQLALARPDLVAGLVLDSPSIDPRYRGRLRGILQLALETQHGMQGRLMLRDYARAGLLRAWQTFEQARADRIETRLPRLRMPVLLIQGASDYLLSDDWAEQLSQLPARGRLVRVDGASHALGFSSVATFCRLVLDFAEDVSAERWKPTAMPADTGESGGRLPAAVIR